MLHTHSESLSKHLFQWIFATLEMLTKKDQELKRAKAKKEDKKSGMEFGKSKVTPGGAKEMSRSDVLKEAL